MAVWQRKPKEKVLIHSDQGSQFTSMDWASYHSLVHSMSRRGNCHNNAVAEFIVHATRLARTCWTASKCSTTRNANASGTGCCRPSSSRRSRKSNPTASTKLGDIPLDRLKIDRSFFTDIPGDAGDKAIVAAIIAMAKTLGLEAVAGGDRKARATNLPRWDRVRCLPGLPSGKAFACCRCGNLHSQNP